jgi:cephalosporin-C deacetylase-like acetyl esterase
MPVYPGALERSTRMRWTEQMAEAIVPRRAVYLSGDFDQYWQFHIDEDSKTPIFLRLERRSKVATPN